MKKNISKMCLMIFFLLIFVVIVWSDINNIKIYDPWWARFVDVWELSLYAVESITLTVIISTFFIILYLELTGRKNGKFI